MRTAESVTFTCWPPFPLERYVSMRRSFSLISTLTSSSMSFVVLCLEREGYYRPDTALAEQAMRPSATFNQIIDSLQP